MAPYEPAHKSGAYICDGVPKLCVLEAAGGSKEFRKRARRLSNPLAPKVLTEDLALAIRRRNFGHRAVNSLDGAFCFGRD